MSKLRYLLFMLVLISVVHAGDKKIYELKFSNAKLGTVLTTLSEVLGINIIIDPELEASKFSDIREVIFKYEKGALLLKRDRTYYEETAFNYSGGGFGGGGSTPGTSVGVTGSADKASPEEADRIRSSRRVTDEIVSPGNFGTVMDKKVTIYVKRPVSVQKMLNIILKSFNLIAVPVDTNTYKITQSAVVEYAIRGLEDTKHKEIIDMVKGRVSPAAEIVIDKKLGRLYITDEIKKIRLYGRAVGEYIDKLIMEATSEEEEPVRKVVTKDGKEELIITRVFYLRYISVEEAKELLLDKIGKTTIINESPSFNALIITDKASKIKEYEKLLSKFVSSPPERRKPITQIFYLKYIKPEEFIRMIEPLRSEAGMVLSGGALRLKSYTQKEQSGGGNTATGTVAATETVQMNEVSSMLTDFNAVMITDYPEVIERIKERYKDYISDAPPQVKIEARIVEIRKELLSEIGLNWGALLSNVPAPESWAGGFGSNIGIGESGLNRPKLSTTPGGILTFTYSRGLLNALNIRLSAFERVGKLKNVAKPTVITINGQTAIIKQGQVVPYQSSVVAGGGSLTQVQFIDVVLRLEVTPVISPDGRVLLDIILVQDIPGTDTPFGPVINKKQVSTKVIVNDGDTLVIGGVIDSSDRKTNEGVAGLVRVPLLKWLFGQEKKEIKDTELLIFITPTILID